MEEEMVHDPELGRLVENVERERDGEEEFHEAVTTAAQRSQSSGWAGSLPTVKRWRQQRAHLVRLVRTTRAPASLPATRVRSLRMKNSSNSSARPCSEESSFSSGSCSVTAASKALPISLA